MSTPVTLPALGESVTEGTVTRWLKRIGDSVAFDEPLLEVSTDKVDTEIPSPADGILLEITAEEDETVQVGGTLAVIGSPAANPAPQADILGAPPAGAVDTGRGHATEVEPDWRRHVTSGAAFVTPLVRTIASQNGLDLSSIAGTGAGGRIRRQDVLAAIEVSRPPATSTELLPPPPPRPAAPRSERRPTTVEKASRLRQTIATRMTESLRTSAQLTQVMEVDVTRVAALRESVRSDFEARVGVKLTFLPFFAAAALDALTRHPKLNAGYDAERGEITYHGYRDLAFAVDTERGLVAPVITDAGDLSIADLASRFAELADRARRNAATPDELSGGTFTISNLGSFGALSDTPIVNQPQVAILGPGAVVKRPVVIEDPELGDTMAIRHRVHLSLSYDHRLVDGADAGRFLLDVRRVLERADFTV